MFENKNRFYAENHGKYILVAFLTTKQVVREPDHVYIPDILIRIFKLKADVYKRQHYSLSWLYTLIVFNVFFLDETIKWSA